MAKKNLKAALASHTAKQAAKAHQQKVEAAQARKSESVKQATKGGGGSGGGAVNKKKRRKLEQQQQQAEVSGATHQGDTLQAGTIDKGKGKATPTGGAGKSKTVNPFAKDDTVLLVGEGEKQWEEENRQCDENRQMLTDLRISLSRRFLFHACLALPTLLSLGNPHPHNILRLGAILP